MNLLLSPLSSASTPVYQQSTTVSVSVLRFPSLPPHPASCLPLDMATTSALRRCPTALTTQLPLRPRLVLSAAARATTAPIAWGDRSQNSRQRSLQTSARRPSQGPSPLLSAIGGFGSSSAIPAAYFQKPSLPANTIIRFVPQQTAWIVERMGKFDRILQPGLAILIPFLDRIAYVKSLKEIALEIPSQSAITADNVTLELDGVLYTRVFDAYKAR